MPSGPSRGTGRVHRRAVWLSGLASVLLFAGIAGYLAPLQPNIIVLQFAHTPAAFAAVIHSWPAEHLARYRTQLVVDFGLLFSYGAFGYLCVTRTPVLAGLSAHLRKAARWALPLAAVFDATENTLHLWLTELPRFGHDAVYVIAASCSAAKWGLLLVFGALVVLSLLRSET
jgi:hypothetical protein